MKSARLLFVPLLAALCLAAAFCPAGARAATEAPGSGGASGRELRIVDDAGQIVSLPGPARRIIPLYAGLGEILVALGAGERIVGRTASDDALPPSLPVVGTHMRPNPEIVTGLAPDLVLQFEGREEAALTSQSLIRLGIPVARFRITSFEELFACIQRLGLLLGEDKAAAILEYSLRQRLEALRETTGGPARRPTVFFEVRYPNLLGAGAGGMVHDIIRTAGGENALASRPERMVRLSEEALALANPDIYLVQQGAMNKSPVPPGQRPHFQGLAAIRRGFVRMVPESLYSRPGPGSVDAAEELAAYIRLWRANPGP